MIQSEYSDIKGRSRKQSGKNLELGIIDTFGSDPNSITQKSSPGIVTNNF